MNEQEKTLLNKLIAIMEQNRNEAEKIDADAYEVYTDILQEYNFALQNKKWTGKENIGETIEQEYEWQLAHI